MSLFGDLSYARPSSTYAGNAMQEYKALNADASAQYEQNRADIDQLELAANSLDLRDVDTPKKRQAIDKIKSDFAQLIERGDYQNAKFIVNKAAKDFNNNQELKGAMQSRQKEVAYQQDLNKRLAEGKIDKDDYERALWESKRSNNKPLKYNPETMGYENMYQGVNMLDSKAKDIYDNAYKRIEGWKEGDLTVNGKSYRKEYKDGNGYIVDEHGTKVDLKEVYDQLTTEIKNRPDFMGYINQKKDTQLWKRFTDPKTGEKIPIRAADLVNDFDLSKEELKTIATKGEVTASELERLNSPFKEDGKTKKTPEELKKDREIYNIQKVVYDKADINQLTPQELEQMYGSLFVEDHIKDYAMPAAEKAAFQKTDRDYREDKYGLLAAKHKLDKDLEKYKKNINNPVYANIENTSVAETVSHKDLQDNFQNLYETNKLIKTIETSYGKNPLGMPKDIANQYNDAQANKKIMEASKSNIYTKMKENGYDVVDNVKNRMFNKVAGNSYNELMLTEFLRSPEVLAKLPSAKAYNEYRKAWDEEIKQGRTGKSLDFKKYTGYNSPDELARQVKKEVESDPYLSKYLNNYIDEAVNVYKNIIKPNHESAATNDYYIDKYNPQLRSFAEIGRLVENQEEEYFEKKADTLYQLNTSVISPDTQKDYTGEAKGADPVNKYHSQWNSLLQSGTEFKTMTGKTPADVVAEYNENRDKNKEKELKLEDLKGGIATKTINGKFAFVVSLPNGTSKIMFPERQDEMARTLNDIGKSYLNQGSDAATQRKGVELLSQVNFHNLKTVIPDAHINNREVGDMIPIDLPVKDNEISTDGTYQKFGIKIKDKLSDGRSTFQLVDKDGNSETFDRIFNKIGGKNEYNSIDDLMYNLQVVELSK